MASDTQADERPGRVTWASQEQGHNAGLRYLCLSSRPLWASGCWLKEGVLGLACSEEAGAGAWAFQENPTSGEGDALSAGCMLFHGRQLQEQVTQALSCPLQGGEMGPQQEGGLWHRGSVLRPMHRAWVMEMDSKSLWGVDPVPWSPALLGA